MARLTLWGTTDIVSISQKICGGRQSVTYLHEKKNSIMLKGNHPVAYQKWIRNTELRGFAYRRKHQIVSIPIAYRVWRLLILHSMSRWPAEYCSMTSFTSYGRNVSLNFRFATWNFMILYQYILDIIFPNFVKISYYMFFRKYKKKIS